ncbi:hypothetical protein FQN50_004897 [Emmonsiellopsis sp. PD_5]|nr:hypothetical protein FQN50_004897 [Emmonsiellopsis sp. PD_5]
MTDDTFLRTISQTLRTHAVEATLFMRKSAIPHFNSAGGCEWKRLAAIRQPKPDSRSGGSENSYPKTSPSDAGYVDKAPRSELDESIGNVDTALTEFQRAARTPNTSLDDNLRQYYLGHPHAKFFHIGDYPAPTDRPFHPIEQQVSFVNFDEYITVLGYGLISEEETQKALSKGLDESTTCLRLIKIPGCGDRRYEGPWRELFKFEHGTLRKALANKSPWRRPNPMRLHFRLDWALVETPDTFTTNKPPAEPDMARLEKRPIRPDEELEWAPNPDFHARHIGFIRHLFSAGLLMSLLRPVLYPQTKSKTLSNHQFSKNDR